MQIRVAEQPGRMARAFAKEAAAKLHIPEPLAVILYRRGIVTLQALREFLHPNLSMLPSPDTLKGMREAVAVIIHALIQQQTIFIHGDYDVDGITATALLMSFFQQTGHRAVFHIPNRLEETYGLSRRSIDRLLDSRLEHQNRAGVLLSVDCGISAREEVLYAKGLGMKVVITDHHEPLGPVPAADAVVNPKQPGCTFVSPVLSGVGVAFFLVMALRSAMMEQGLLSASSMPNLKQHLDLVALGTVADVVPLIDVNRVLVRAGLEVLSKKHRPGVFFLCERCGLENGQVTTEDISFRLAPRINASGRLGKPEIGVDLLIAGTSEQAKAAASALEVLNGERKRLELDCLPGIMQQGQELVSAGSPGLVVHAGNCHPGVMGILASRMAERFQRPAILFAGTAGEGETVLKGSGRSVPGVHLFHILEQCVEYIKQFGGHAMAVGLTVEQTRLQAFAEQFNATLATLDLRPQEQGVFVDHHFTLKEDLTTEFAHFLQYLQPFGVGNPEPVFLLKNESLLQQKSTKGHLLFQVRPADGQVFRGVGFNLATTDASFSGSMDLVFTIKRSRFRGEETDQIHAIHLAPS